MMGSSSILWQSSVVSSPMKVALDRSSTPRSARSWIVNTSSYNCSLFTVAVNCFTCSLLLLFVLNNCAFSENECVWQITRKNRDGGNNCIVRYIFRFSLFLPNIYLLPHNNGGKFKYHAPFQIFLCLLLYCSSFDPLCVEEK